MVQLSNDVSDRGGDSQGSEHLEVARAEVTAGWSDFTKAATTGSASAVDCLPRLILVDSPANNDNSDTASRTPEPPSGDALDPRRLTFAKTPSEDPGDTLLAVGTNDTDLGNNGPWATARMREDGNLLSIELAEDGSGRGERRIDLRRLQRGLTPEEGRVRTEDNGDTIYLSPGGRLRVRIGPCGAVLSIHIADDDGRWQLRYQPGPTRRQIQQADCSS